MKAAVIDVGYNSLKMVKYRVEPDGFLKTYGQFGVMARLGEGLERTKFLKKEAVERTVNAIRLCSEAASIESIKHVLLVGTSPVREASNREEFLARVRDETGLTMRVLSGNEEALYALLGASRSVDADPALYFDLGGGSLELIYAKGGAVKRVLSLPLGCLKLTDLFVDEDGSFSRKNRSKMGKEVMGLLPSRRELGLEKDTVLVGTGGTVRALARFDQEVEGYPLNKIHNYVVQEESVQQMSKKLFELKVRELGKIDAIGEDRAQSIAAGSMVVRQLMKRLNFDSMVVSTHGLRDGIVADFFEGGSTRPGAIQKEDVEKLLRPREPSPRYSDHVGFVNCLVRNRLLDERQGDIALKALDRGRASDSVNANPDALFWIVMSEDLPMSHEDQILLAASLVRARRARTASWLVERFGGLMKRDDQKSVRRIGGALRLLEVLDRSSVRFVTAYSGGVRVGIATSESQFPLGLAKAAASSLEAAIKRPVSVSLSRRGRKLLPRLVKVSR